MNKYDISIVIPSINPDRWLNIFKQLSLSAAPFSFQLICVGSNFPPKELESNNNFIYIRDFGSPARCFQIGSTVATGEYIAFIPDDCIVDEGSFAECITLFKTIEECRGIILRYTEGPNYTGNQDINLDYWTARFHDSLKLNLIKTDWKIAPCFMYKLSTFREYGGLNCSFEHVNMNTHQLAFNIQNDGGKILFSPKRVFRANWQPWSNTNKSPIQLAFELNDNPLFNKVYNGFEIPPKVDYNNWQLSEPFWKRRYEKI